MFLNGSGQLAHWKEIQIFCGEELYLYQHVGHSNVSQQSVLCKYSPLQGYPYVGGIIHIYLNQICGMFKPLDRGIQEFRPKPRDGPETRSSERKLNYFFGALT
jgi:hypothetical protein